jgi:outer membrane protein
MIAVGLRLLVALAVAPAPTGTITVDQALAVMHRNLPALRLAQANTEQFRAVHDQYVGAWYPTASANIGYKRTTANGAYTPGYDTPTSAPTLNTSDTLSSSLSVNQLIWDFGNTTNKIAAADETANSYQEQERVALLQADYALRTAFFTAAANKELVTVAEENWKNTDAHLAQARALVKAGTNTEIDIATSRASVANAMVQLITARNNYATAKTKLNQAMGVEGGTDYEVVAPSNTPVPGEDSPLEKLVDEGLSSRPEQASLQAQLRSAEYSIKDYLDNWYPTLSANAGITYAGGDPTGPLAMAPNASVGLSLTWQANLGPVIPSLVRQQVAQRDQVQAMVDALRLQVRVDVQTAQLAVNAALESLTSAHEALDAAREQLKLATGRYAAGLGNQVELGDAQVAADQAGAQDVAALYTLYSARAQLIEALGRK